MIGGSTRLFAIVGDPIAQARSPQVFNALFGRWGLDAVLVPMQVPADGLAAALDGLRQVRNLDGVVVTVPHKITAAHSIERLSETAREVGAVNCLRRGADGAWEGEIFDGEGFVRSLAARGFALRGQRVYLAGAGGAGRALAHAMAQAGVAALQLMDVDVARAQALRDALGRRHPGLQLSLADARPQGVALAVNATPCGMGGGSQTPFALDGLDAQALVADIVMQPAQTALLAQAAARGLATHAGQGLLDHQAECVARFFGLAPRTGTEAATDELKETST